MRPFLSPLNRPFLRAFQSAEAALSGNVTAGPPPASPWTPASLANAVWYVADDPANTVVSGLTTVLKDKIGGMDMVAVRGGAVMSSTLNGRPTLTTDNAGNGVFQSAAAGSMIGASSGAVSFFVVHRLIDANSQGFPAVAAVMFGTSQTTLQTAMLRSEAGTSHPPGSISLRTRPNSGDTGVEIGSDLDYGTGWLIAGSSRRYDQNDGYIWVNGTQVAGGAMNASTTTASGGYTLVLGNYSMDPSDLWSQGIAEFIAIRGDVSDATRQKIEGYYANRWALQAGLPSNHPYKSAAPT